MRARRFLPLLTIMALSFTALSAGATTARPHRAPASATYRDVILADGPMMYWRLGEISGTMAFDETANHRDAAYVNDPRLGLPGAIADDPNTSVGFNGSNQYAAWDPDTAQTGSFSVEAWIRLRPATPTLLDTFVSSRTKLAEYSFDLKVQNVSGLPELHLDVGDGFTWLDTGAVPIRFRSGVWYYVAATVTGTEDVLYVDGVAVATFTHGGVPLLFDQAHKVQVGTDIRYDDEWFHGKIDEVAVYGYALSSDQVAAHYQAGISP